MKRLLPAAVLALMLMGCAGLQDFKTGNEVVSAADVAEKGDDKLSCDQISAQVDAMNDTITKSQRMTSEVVNHRTRLDAPIDSPDNNRVSPNAVFGSGYPAIGTASTVATNGATIKDNQELMDQGMTAQTAIARANYLIPIGKKKHCWRD